MSDFAKIEVTKNNDTKTASTSTHRRNNDDAANVSTKQHNVFGKIVNYFKHEDPGVDVDYETDIIIKKEKDDYQIAISQDGKFAATFDTANLLIKILQNTDYRSFKKKLSSDNKNESNGSIEIDKTIAYFKINDDFNIKKFYRNETKTEYKESVSKEGEENDDFNVKNVVIGSGELDDFNIDSNETKIKYEKSASRKKDKFRWSFDVSNMHHKNDAESFIFVAISRINIDEDMRKTEEPDYERKNLHERKFKISNEPPVFEHKVRITEESKETALPNKGIAIYRIELIIEDKDEVNEEEKKDKKKEKKNEKNEKRDEENYVINAVTCYYSNNISGICRFIESSSEDNVDKSRDVVIKLRRFIILNIHGIYDLEFNDHYDSFKPGEKFEYPQSLKRKLNNWYSDKSGGCMKRLLSCIYDKYFLVTLYKKDIQSFEVYNLEKMELETTAKRVKKEDELHNFVEKKNYNCFTISRLHLCYTQGNNIIKLYCMENGLQVVSKKFEEVERIHLLEFIDGDKKLLIIGEDPKDDSKKKLKFIVWNLYKTGKYEIGDFQITNIDNVENPDTCFNMENLDACLARTSGNILQIGNDGKVSSVVKKVKEILRQNNENDEVKYLKISESDNSVIKVDKKNINKIEPWVPYKYERKIYTFDHENETFQLIVGSSTVQIWHRIKNEDDNKDKYEFFHKDKSFLEYIWTNHIPVNQEREKTELRVDTLEYVLEDGSANKISDFYLRVYWYESKNAKMGEQDIQEDRDYTKVKEYAKEEDKDIDDIENKRINDSLKVKRCEKEIKLKDVIEKFRVIRHACRALEHFNKRYINKDLVDNYARACNHEIMITYIKHIVWKFVKYDPQNFKLLDVRYNIMKNLILSDCDDLIKFILFGDDETFRNKNEEIGHIPKNKLWPEKEFLRGDDLDFDKRKDKLKDKFEPQNDMELAIYHCKGKRLKFIIYIIKYHLLQLSSITDKDTTIVAYLLEYYSRNARNCAGWMCTVSKAIPLLFEYYDSYAEKLFFKECFAGQTQDSVEILEQYLERHDNKFRTFEVDKMKTYKHKYFKDKNFKIIESPLLRIVPLSNFTVSNIEKKTEEHDSFKIISNRILLLFIPQRYKFSPNDKIKLSPFSRMVLCRNDNIYINPAIEAVINFRWRTARNYFFSLFIRFLIFAICFGLISWAYLNHNTLISPNFLFIIIVLFYYLAIYQLITELLQFRYHGSKNYFSEIYNIFDVISILFTVIIMSIICKYFKFSDGFGSIEETNTGLIVGISFSIFLLWIELIFYLRLIPYIGIYIYHVEIICKTIFPFFLFILIVVLAFTHTMFILLRNPVNIPTINSTYSGVATNALTNETLIIELTSDFDPTSSDNPYTSFSRAIMATYFWISDIWVQTNEFDFWVVDIYTFIASIFLVIILQNMLIAFMSDEYTEVRAKSRQILLKNKANHIADYEALHHLNSEPQPKYIYYIGQPENYEEWHNTRKDNVKSSICENLNEKSILTKFMRRDYDQYSIWKYDNYDNIIRMNTEKFKNDFSKNTKYLIEKFNVGRKSIDRVDKIKKMLKDEVKKFYNESIEGINIVKESLNEEVNNFEN
ncbi:hypothetical protein GLOIN_2v1769896 [Rhizophagus clarus]|uniref:Ion transport domain-containing protein n=1 Tax=Rhizophagus clarus TaxID=94130 RepID=A0A8H3KS62_9GLOM|nr:hypothetical protein GLOIN_2v1769896 [Rhizophagus clarus]